MSADSAQAVRLELLPPGSELSLMPVVVARLRKLAVQVARPQEANVFGEALYLLQIADVLEEQYEVMRPKTCREREAVPGWLPDVCARVVSRVLGRRVGA
jgi:hypothetical protein